MAESSAEAIFAEEDFTPYARQRDAAVQSSLPLTLIQGQTVQHPEAVLKSDGTPYTVFTPYSKAWKGLLPAVGDEVYPPEQISTPSDISSEPLPEFKSARA